jgi:hypothetical protein
MGFFDSLKKLFSSTGQPPDRGRYYYVKLDKSGEIVRIRLDPQHDLAPQYGKGTYTSHKAIIGPETLARAEAVFTFDENRQFVEADISGGSLTDEEAYQAQNINKGD